MNASVRSADSRRVTLGLAFAAMAMLSFVVAGLLANHVVDRGAPPVVVAFYEALFGLLLALGVRARSLRGGRPPGRAALAWMFAAGALFALAAASFYTALARIDFSVAAPITGATPLVSYVFVLVMLRGYERLTPRVVLGAALVVVGVGVIGAAN